MPDQTDDIREQEGSCNNIHLAVHTHHVGPNRNTCQIRQMIYGIRKDPVTIYTLQI